MILEKGVPPSLLFHQTHGTINNAPIDLMILNRRHGKTANKMKNIDWKSAKKLKADFDAEIVFRES